jgi:hypothetical protein
MKEISARFVLVVLLGGPDAVVAGRAFVEDAAVATIVDAVVSEAVVEAKPPFVSPLL